MNKEYGWKKWFFRIATLTIPGPFLQGSSANLLVESNQRNSLPGGVQLLGVLLIISGLILIGLAEWALLAHGGASGAPGDPTSRLVTGGIYAWTRNPIFTGGFLVLAGLGLFRSSTGFLFAAGFFIILIHFYVIFFEEPRTSRRFGDPYTAYQREVPRWGFPPPRRKRKGR